MSTPALHIACQQLLLLHVKDHWWPLYSSCSVNSRWSLRRSCSIQIAVSLQACRDSAPKILSPCTSSTCAGTQVPSTATPSPAVAATDSIGNLTACVKITQKAVDLTLTLLELHPLSQQSSPEVSCAQPAQHQALPINNDSPARSTARTAAGVAGAQAAPPFSEMWPHPKRSNINHQSVGRCLDPYLLGMHCTKELRNGYLQ